jgi:hypothetical protein
MIIWYIIGVSSIIILGSFLVARMHKKRQKRADYEKKQQQNDIIQLTDRIIQENIYVNDTLLLMGTHQQRQKVMEKLKLSNQDILQALRKRKENIMNYPGVIWLCDYLIRNDKQFEQAYGELHKAIMAEMNRRKKKKG